MKSIIYFFLSIILLSCSNGQADNNEDSNTETYKTTSDMSYWYQGLAELNSYELKQSRYGQVHEGTAVLIFVTEPFNTEKQVKADKPDQVPSTNVLKLNFTKKFTTGVYPYSIMSSVFTPIDQKVYPNTLKVSTTSQDWCGHSFMQLNLKKGKYHVGQFSYFESEGDRSTEVEKVLLEDEIWNLIRLQGSNLPEGKIKIYPSTQYIRLKHKENEVLEADASLKKGKEINTYNINYSDRSLSIEFENKEPFKIIGWTENYILNDGSTPENLTTTATLKETIMLDYWNKHDVVDSVYRSKLGLE